MKYKQYVEEYNPSANKQIKHMSKEFAEGFEDIHTFEPTERDENPPTIRPTQSPMQTSFSYSPSSFPTNNVYTYTPFSYTYSPNAKTNNPICVLTYSPSKDVSTNNRTEYEYYVYMNDKYNTIIFVMATGIGSFCFCVICAYVYKIYASNKHKLQKIRKNTLNRKYAKENPSSLKNEDSSHNFQSFTEENVSLNNIHIADYNSQF
jgi:hypothetical protein